MSASDKLELAYERMMLHIDAWAAKAREEGKLVEHWFRDAADSAIDAELKLETLTRDEASKVVAYLSRDLHDAAEHARASGKEMKFWFDFDTALIESQLHDAFVNAADPTMMDQLRLIRDAEDNPLYATGETTGPGTLVCAACDHKLQFVKPTTIPACPQCGGEAFSRQQADT